MPACARTSRSFRMAAARSWSRTAGEHSPSTAQISRALMRQAIDVDAPVIGRAIDAALPDDRAVELGMHEGVLRSPVLAVPDHLEPLGAVRIGGEILRVVNQE